MRQLAGEFYGTMRHGRRFSGFVLADTAYPAWTRIPQHTHVRPYVSRILRGEYLERCGSRVRRCEAGMVFVHPAGETHADSFGARDSRVISLELSELQWPTDAMVTDEDPSRLCQIANLMSRLEGELAYGDDTSLLSVEAIAFELTGLLDGTARWDRRRPQWLADAVALIRERFAEAVSLTQLAATVGVHPIHLARTFRAVQRCTVGEYVRSLRVRLACRALAETSQSVAEIAVQAGFSDQSHLCRVLRRQIGLTPSQFRTALQ